MASALTGMGYADAINGVPTGNNRIIMCQGIARNATEGAGGSDLWPPTTVRFVAAAIGCGHCPPNPYLSPRLNRWPLFYKTFPSTDSVTTRQGRSFPLRSSARLTANSSPPQQGTSMRVTVTERTSFSERMASSFWE